MGQVTAATIKMVRDALANKEPPPLTAWEYEQLCRIWEMHSDPWRNISSAPKDGTFILAAYSSGHRNIVQWATNEYHWRTNVDSTAKWSPPLWMPLPSAPVGSGASDNSVGSRPPPLP